MCAAQPGLRLMIDSGLIVFVLLAPFVGARSLNSQNMWSYIEFKTSLRGWLQANQSLFTKDLYPSADPRWRNIFRAATIKYLCHKIIKSTRHNLLRPKKLFEIFGFCLKLFNLLSQKTKTPKYQLSTCRKEIFFGYKNDFINWLIKSEHVQMFLFCNRPGCSAPQGTADLWLMGMLLAVPKAMKCAAAWLLILSARYSCVHLKLHSKPPYLQFPACLWTSRRGEGQKMISSIPQNWGT